MTSSAITGGQTIKVAHSTTAGAVPASMVNGQLAINHADQKIYALGSDGSTVQSVLDTWRNEITDALANDVSYLALMVGGLKGALGQLPDGFDDNYTDETGIDTSNSSGITWSSGFVSNAPLPTWTPANLSGSPAVFWLDAAQTSTLTLSGSSVTSWASRVGSATAAAASGNYPTYSSTARNSLPGVTVGAQGMAISSLTGFPTGAAASSFAGVGYNTGTAAYESMIAWGPAATGQQRLLGTNGSGYGVFSTYNNDYVGSSLWNGNDMVFFGETTGVASSSIDISVNGTDTTESSNSTALNTGSSAGYVGSSVSATNRVWDGVIQEVIVFNRVLTSTERQQLEGYLAWKWGLQAKLPGGHPYKSAAPSITPTPTAMTLQSLAPVTLKSTPTRVGLYILGNIGGGAINTDLTASVSRDGSTFTAGTLTAIATFSGSKTLYELQGSDGLPGVIVTGQPTGATPKYKLTTTSTYNITDYGVVLRAA